ncbi:serine--tRNA ligase [Candidatus Woesearchaeota archaeon]|nr:serine--tRNA ligase [Candidatus Woesearchaeota archaeon]
MLDIKIIRENPDMVKENIRKKFQDDLLPLVDEILALDSEYRKQLSESQELRSSRNKITQEINEIKKNGGDVLAKLEDAKKIPARIKELEESVVELKAKIDVLLPRIPNIMHESVPLGKDDSENVERKRVGTPREFSFEIRNHVDIIELNDWADFDTSAKTSGTGFYYLKGDLALLNQALIRFAIEYMSGKGYTYIEPPLMLHKEVLDAAMDTASFANTIYAVRDEDLNLIGTSEHALLGLHTSEAISENDLPKKYFSYSMCFRREIGSHGINEKGLWRTHQFNKVEQFIFCKPEDSYKFYDELLSNSEGLFQALELPYRVIECCSGDLATWKAKSADMEVYRPTTKSYGEITSLTNCTDFQSRGLGIRVVYNNGERALLHTLNNTAIATSRALVGIIENNQNEDGSINVPAVLVPFMFGRSVIGGKK